MQGDARCRDTSRVNGHAAAVAEGTHIISSAPRFDVIIEETLRSSQLHRSIPPLTVHHGPGSWFFKDASLRSVDRSDQA